MVASLCNSMAQSENNSFFIKNEHQGYSPCYDCLYETEDKATFMYKCMEHQTFQKYRALQVCLRTSQVDFSVLNDTD